MAMLSDTNLFRSVGSQQRLHDRVVAEIEQRIIDGDLAPGRKLPPERELAETLGVSRTVLREAMRVLAAKGLLEAQQGIGTTVRALTSRHVVEPLGLYLRAQEGGVISFHHLHQVRSLLEVEIAGIAAESATDEEIAQLREVYESMVEAMNNVELLAEQDAEFHRTLAAMTHNPLLLVLIDSIRELLREYIAQVTVYLDPLEDNIRLHYLLLERVVARDREGARAAMETNLEQMRRNTKLYAQVKHTLSPAEESDESPA
jgi:GntR family transcriptional repressor for pyruvate dehydrogenase complex